MYAAKHSGEAPPSGYTFRYTRKVSLPNVQPFLRILAYEVSSPDSTGKPLVRGDPLFSARAAPILGPATPILSAGDHYSQRTAEKKREKHFGTEVGEDIKGGVVAITGAARGKGRLVITFGK
jgi:hypothetical protein